MFLKRTNFITILLCAGVRRDSKTGKMAEPYESLIKGEGLAQVKECLLGLLGEGGRHWETPGTDVHGEQGCLADI
jgi:hypothetical protein